MGALQRASDARVEDNPNPAAAPRAPAADAPGSPDVYAELEEIRTALRGAAWDPTPPPRPSQIPTPPPTSDPPPLPILYLAGRISSAGLAARALREEVTTLSRRWDAVEGQLRTMEEQLHQADRELAFLREQSWLGFEEPREDTPATEPWDESVADAEPPESVQLGMSVLPPAPSGPAFAAFTATRYDAAIAALKSRRLRIAGWTLAVGGALTIALEALNFLAREPAPPLALAALPLVWMIPVPFFLLAFRGTQRTLRRNHLETGLAP